MKNFLALMCMAAPLWLAAQPFTLVRSDFLQDFQTGNECFGLSVDTAYAAGGDSIFHFYPALGSTYVASISDYCYDIDGPTWLGDSVRLAPGGVYTFYPSGGDPVTLHANAGVGDEWICWTTWYGYLKASVVSISPALTFGQPDSVKALVLKSFDRQGNPVAYPLNNERILLSKNVGILQIPGIRGWPDDPLFVQTDSGRLSYKEIYDFAVGDSFQVRTTKVNWDVNVMTHELLVVRDKQVQSSTVIYQMSRNVFVDTLFLGYPATFQFVDTVTRIFPYSEQLLLPVMPGEVYWENNYGQYPSYLQSHLYKGNRGRSWTFQAPGYAAEPFGDSTCFREINNLVADHLIERHTYEEGLGHFFWKNAGPWYTHNRELIFYRKGAEVWGNLFVKTEDLMPPLAFEVYPNPLQGSFRLRLQLSRLMEIRIELWDLQGREIALLYEGTLGREDMAFSTQGWASGLYLMTVRGGGVWGSKKVVVE